MRVPNREPGGIHLQEFEVLFWKPDAAQALLDGDVRKPDVAQFEMLLDGAREPGAVHMLLAAVSCNSAACLACQPQAVPS
eukprot:1156504-Pelagomonas_calceolata.AAC.9